MLIVAVVLLALLAGDPLAVPLPVMAAAAGLWQLSRPAIKSEMLGTDVAVPATARGSEVGEAAEVAG